MGFKKNFSALKEQNIIPAEIDESVLSEAVQDAIASLTKKEIEALKRLCDSTNSHLALHYRDSNIVTFGL